MTTKEVKEIFARERQSIPTCNLRNYDLICEAYLPMMMKTDNFEKTARQCWRRISNLKRHDHSRIPADLPRLQGETPTEYVNRVYAVSGYTMT